MKADLKEFINAVGFLVMLVAFLLIDAKDLLKKSKHL
jgi:hypothetical protein